MGVTSRGLFLLLDHDGVVFLSGESHRGPLTLNLERDLLARLAGLEAGAVLQLAPGRLVFPGPPAALHGAAAWDGSAVLDWSAAPRWAPAVAGGPLLPADERRRRGQAVAQQAARSERRSLLIELLPCAWGMEAAGGAAPALYPRFQQAQAAWQAGDAAGLAAALGGFVGLGSGLTPSGDDLILGFLLALGRWGAALCPAWSAARRQALGAALVAQVRGGSSTLCAGLAECAARGQADERLVLALDGLVSGPFAPAACAAALAGWGHSSGFDALVGMGLATTGLPVKL